MPFATPGAQKNGADRKMVAVRIRAFPSQVALTNTSETNSRCPPEVGLLRDRGEMPGTAATVETE